MVTIAVSLAPMSIAGTTFWDIAPNVFFRGSGDGPVSLLVDGTATQIRILNGVVEFTNLIMAGERLELIGFNASSNAQVGVVGVTTERVIFNVDGANGVTTTIVVKAPPDRRVTRVNGADSFTFDDSTDLAVITDVHGLFTRQMVVFFNPVSGSFAQSSNTLITIFGLVAVVSGFVLALQVGSGQIFTGPTFALVGFLLASVIAIAVLNIVGAIFN